MSTLAVLFYSICNVIAKGKHHSLSFTVIAVRICDYPYANIERTMWWWLSDGQQQQQQQQQG